jgi:hypothetical protein
MFATVSLAYLFDMFKEVHVCILATQKKVFVSLPIFSLFYFIFDILSEHCLFSRARARSDSHSILNFLDCVCVCFFNCK